MEAEKPLTHTDLCETCDNKLCIEICSGQAITAGDKGILLYQLGVEVLVQKTRP